MSKDRLIRLIAFETGIDDDKAEKAIEVMESYLRERFPSIMHKTLEKAFEGQHVEDTLKEQFAQSTEETKDKIAEFAKEAGKKMEVFSMELKHKFDEFFQKKEK